MDCGKPHFSNVPDFLEWLEQQIESIVGRMRRGWLKGSMVDGECRQAARHTCDVMALLCDDPDVSIKFSILPPTPTECGLELTLLRVAAGWCRRTLRDEAETAEREQATPKTAQMSWREVAERLERLRGQGEPFTSQRNLAKQLGCSSGLINKAINQTPALQTWAKRNAAVPEAKTVTQRGSEAAIRIEQSREPDPVDAIAIREYLERDLDLEERAFFNGLSAENQLEHINDPDKHSLDEQVRIRDRRP